MSLASLYLIIIPAVCALVLYSLNGKYKTGGKIFFIAAALFNLWAACYYFNKNIFAYSSWADFDFSFSIVISSFSVFLLIIIAFFAALSAIFAFNNMKDNPKATLFNASMLLAVAFVNAILITDSLVFLLAFTEILAIPFVLMILSSENNNNKLAFKSFAITAVADLFFMLGIALVYSVSQTANISEIYLTLDGWLNVFAFICIIIGAAGKLGVMPFHSWLPEASEKTPVPFMVFMATAAEKAVGIYIAYIALKMFNVHVPGCVIYWIMAFVALGTVLSALMSNGQKSFKRALIYTSISQGGFMLLAVLSAVPIAIVGALLHFLAHTVYKSCLFFSAGIMDEIKEEKISFRNNPYIFFCFILAAASFIGVPFFAAFYSKEFIYEGAMQAGVIWFICASLATFFCSSAVLEWFFKIFFDNSGARREYHILSMAPVIATALLCLFLGIFNKVPLTAINSFIPLEPAAHAAETAGAGLGGHLILLISISALLIVLLNAIIGFAKYKNPLGFVKGLSQWLKIDKLCANDDADPYEITLKAYKSFARASFEFDAMLNYVYDGFIVKSVFYCSQTLKKLHNGSLPRYIIWTLAGIVVIFAVFL